MTSRYFRSTREAFPCERFPAVFGPFERPAPIKQALRVFAWFCAFAFIGVLMAWRF